MQKSPGQETHGPWGEEGGGGIRCAPGEELPALRKPCSGEWWAPCCAPPNARFSRKDPAKLFAGINQVRGPNLSVAAPGPLDQPFIQGALAGPHLPESELYDAGTEAGTDRGA